MNEITVPLDVGITELLASRAKARQDAANELTNLAGRLHKTIEVSDQATDDLYDLITWVRGLELVPVNDMAAAMGRDRNYVDSVWSDRDEKREIHGEWFGLSRDASPSLVLSTLIRVSDKQKEAVQLVKAERAERDLAIVRVYQGKILGPSDISRVVGVDRNHVGRIAKRHGVGPVHRENVRNQHTAV